MVDRVALPLKQRLDYGTISVNAYMCRSWAAGLVNRELFRREKGEVKMEYTQVIHDEILQATIVGMKSDTAKRAEM